MAAIDPQTLLEEAKCYACFAQASLPEMLKLALLSRIATSGGGGGGSQTPWLSNIDGGGFDLSNVDNISAASFTGNLTGNVTGASSLNVLKAGDTMTGLLTIAQATANTSALAVTGYSLTGANAQSLLSLEGTWNTSGTPDGILLNLTNASSGINSTLLNLKAGGQTILSVRAADGLITVSRTSAGTASTITPRSTGGVGLTFSGRVTTGSLLGIGADDVLLARDAANALAQRNGTSDQTFRWYRTFTDASNYERGALQTAAGQVIVAAETAGTGTDDIDLTLTPAGAGNVRFGTHSALAGETLSGFITFKDAAGNVRKLAVIS